MQQALEQERQKGRNASPTINKVSQRIEHKQPFHERLYPAHSPAREEGSLNYSASPHTLVDRRLTSPQTSFSPSGSP